MRRILTVNTIIILMFASLTYWTEEKEQLELVISSNVKNTADSIEMMSDDEGQKKNGYMQNVDFDVSKFALSETYEYDRDTYGTETHIGWIDQLAWAAAFTGGSFEQDRTVLLHLEQLRTAVKEGKKLDKLTKDLEYFADYRELYEAVLGGMVGEYEIQVQASDQRDRAVWEKRYGLKAFHPIAKGFPYHLGQELIGQIGTPIVAVESGYIEDIGWNQYKGWRIGVRSFDGKRYYEYAHLRQGFPWQSELKKGSVVLAGDVIGYMGNTGYRSTEDKTAVKDPHLHLGIQLIPDESQKEDKNGIWINGDPLVNFLYRNQSEAAQNTVTKEWRRIYQMKDPAAEAYERTVDFSMYP